MAGLAPSDSPSPLPALRPRSASVMLYNGVSNRSRGWKSRQPGDLEMWDGKMFRQPALKKFDGASRSSFAWDRLRKVRCPGDLESQTQPPFCRRTLQTQQHVI